MLDWSIDIDIPSFFLQLTIHTQNSSQTHPIVNIHSVSVYHKALARLLELQTLPALTLLQERHKHNLEKVLLLYMRTYTYLFSCNLPLECINITLSDSVWSSNNLVLINLPSFGFSLLSQIQSLREDKKQLETIRDQQQQHQSMNL